MAIMIMTNNSKDSNTSDDILLQKQNTKTNETTNRCRKQTNCKHNYNNKRYKNEQHYK